VTGRSLSVKFAVRVSNRLLIMINADLNNKTALITGAASGIGFATAQKFAQCGCTVALNDLPNNERLIQSVKALSDQGFKVIAAPGDAGDEASALAMVETAMNELGSIDFLVNNAGTPGTRSPIPANDMQTPDAAFWEKLLSVNLLGPWYCTKAALPSLRERGGAIVNTASTAGIVGNGSSSTYSATKAALISLTREHARAFGPDVRVNAIAPGVVESDWECRFDRSTEMLAGIPLKRAGLPDDYADAILYLCAGGSYVTGHTLVVDGGLTVGPSVTD